MSVFNNLYIKCHLPHFGSEPLYETTYRTENRGRLLVLFCVVICLFLLDLPYMFVSGIFFFFWYIKKCMAFGIRCTKGSGIQILVTPLTCYVILDTWLNLSAF